MTELKIDPEFRDKIPPLTEAEFKQLEENIVADGEVREPIVAWNGTIIDGHNRWAIIQKHPEIPYKVKAMEFSDKWAAIYWMVNNQLGRRNITDEQKTYLLGKLYEARKNAVGAPVGNTNAKQCTQSGNIEANQPNRVSEQIAKERGIAKNSVIRANNFAHGLDAADTVSPGFKDAVLTGEVKAPKAKIAEIAKMDEPVKKQAVEALQSGDAEKIKEVFDRPIRTTAKPEAPKYEIVDDGEYNTDDFYDELMATIGTFKRNFKSTLFIHSEMLQNGGREKAIAALSEAEAAINEIKELLK